MQALSIITKLRRLRFALLLLDTDGATSPVRARMQGALGLLDAAVSFVSLGDATYLSSGAEPTYLLPTLSPRLGLALSQASNLAHDIAQEGRKTLGAKRGSYFARAWACMREAESELSLASLAWHVANPEP